MTSILFKPLISSAILQLINTFRPRQNGRHFTDDIFKRIFLDENVRIPIKISLQLVAKGPINNIPGDKPLSEPIVIRLSTHICVTRPQWVKYADPEQLLIFAFSSFLWPSLDICLPCFTIFRELYSNVFLMRLRWVKGNAATTFFPYQYFICYVS